MKRGKGVRAIRFAGGGWLFPFYFGVAKSLGAHVDMGKIRVGGVSAGSVVAAMLLLGVDMEKVLVDVIKRYKETRYNPFLIRDCLEKALGDMVDGQGDEGAMANALSGRLEIGVVTPDLWRMQLRQWVVTEYDKMKDCMDALKASCHIPLLSGMFPRWVMGKACYDGEMPVALGIEMDRKFTESYCIKVGIDGGCICPGVAIPDVWRFFPADPFVMRLLMELGELRAKEYLGAAGWVEKKRAGEIAEVIAFLVRTGHVCLWEKMWGMWRGWVFTIGGAWIVWRLLRKRLKRAPGGYQAIEL